MNVLVYVITQALLFTGALVWQVRECFKEAGKHNEEEGAAPVADDTDKKEDGETGAKLQGADIYKVDDEDNANAVKGAVNESFKDEGADKVGY